MTDLRGNAVIRETEVWFPEAAKINIYAVSADAAGSLYFAADVWALSKLGAGIIGKVSQGNGPMLIIRTDDFVPLELVVTPDGNIWTFGVPLLTQSLKTTSDDYPTVWRFDPTGRLTGKFLPRSTFGPKVIPTHGFGDVGWPHIVYGNGAVGVFSATANRWLEINPFTGKTKTDLTVERPAASDGVLPMMADLVELDSGSVYAFFTFRIIDARHKPALYRLDKQKARWMRVREQPGEGGFGGLFGSDGEQVILRAGRGRFGWFPATGFDAKP